MDRRRLLKLALAGLGGLAALRFGLPWWWRVGPPRALEPEVGAWVEGKLAGLDLSAVWDTHCHVVGVGAGGSGCWVNPEMLSHANPWRRLQFDCYLAGAGISLGGDPDAEYLERLLALHRLANPAGKLVAFAFDYHIDDAGREVPEASTFFVPDEYVLRLAAEHDDLVACASVHPYRTDALARLDAAVAAGAVAVKWLPNAMGIDPASPRCDAFYARLVHHGIPLITHAGHESAVHADEHQEYGNPLRIRSALDAGVKVCMAHCGSLGEMRDLDAGKTGGERKRESFELFLRVFREPRWAERFFADISAVTFVNRADVVLRELLVAEDLHPRLVNGTDYPVVAVDPVISTRMLAMDGLLSDEDRSMCERVFEANPLLFDLVLKRSLRLQADGVTHRFADAVFETRRLFV